MMQIRRGSAIYIEYETIQRTLVVPQRRDPDGGVFLILWDPTGAFALNEVSMIKVRTGVYSYTYQSVPSSPLGQWVSTASVIHQGRPTPALRKDIAFTLVS